MIRDFSQETVDALYETIRTNIEEEEQWKVFDSWDDFGMEELEIGDYINNIEQYHRHMFDKHDVTTKKFDGILKRVSWVDNLYAEWMRGYRLQLEAFRIKLNSVAEMLNPEMLALNPEKYAAKIEAINMVYQNVKESHEKMQQKLELEQQELERQIFEAEATWSEKFAKKALGFLEEAEDYLKRSGECFILGNFTEEVTLLGVGGQVLAGLAGVDFLLDVRDIIADVKNIDEAEKVQWEQVGIFLLDVCALFPIIGCLKYADEAAVLIKNADKLKYADEAAELAKHADKLKYVDEAGELLTEGRKLADSGIKGLEDAVAEARKLEKELAGSKLLDDVGDGSPFVPVENITGMDWYDYFRETYGKKNVCWENCNPSEVATAWQGSYPYVGVDTYTNITLYDGDIIWMGEPFPTGYSTITEAIAGLGNDAQKVFGGLQVKPYYEKGMPFAEYRSSLVPYKIHGELNVAEGFAHNNSQFGVGGLAQRFDPNFDYNYANGFLERLEEQAIELTNTKVSLEDYFTMMAEIK